MQKNEPIHAALEFLTSNHRAVLITRKRSGGLQSSPVAAVSDGEGRVLVSTREGSAKERNASRTPALSLCAVSETWYGPWVHVDGEAEVIRLPEAMDLLVDYYRRIRGDHPNWDEYRAAMDSERRVMLRIRPLAATPIAAT